MSLSMASIQPMIDWLHAHSHLALLLTFFISFCESLAVVGTIVPGSITMTAIGILAGSGVIRVDLTILASTLGAIVGDGASYLLGYFYSDRLNQIWPFRRYPLLLNYGKEFFINHGKKSVLLGRFVGPLRAIIPVIAGMMRMNQWQFYLANIISGFLWSLLYVIPGVMIGSATTELSPESAIRFSMMILLILFSVWLFSKLLRWLIIQFNAFLSKKSHLLWEKLLIYPKTSRIFLAITPPDENNHYATAMQSLLLLTLIALLIILSIAMMQSTGLHEWNLATSNWVQSFRTTRFDTFFIYVSQIKSHLTLSTLAVTVFIAALLAKRWHLTVYWAALLVSTYCAVVLYEALVLLRTYNGFAIQEHFETCFAFAIVMYGGIFYYIQRNRLLKFRPYYDYFLILSLLLLGYSQMVLGNLWLTDILAIYLLDSIILCLFYLIYRRNRPETVSTRYFIGPLLAIMVIAYVMSCLFNLKKDIHGRQPFYTEYLFTENQWWDQQNPLLPIYQKSRLGRVISLFNIQYAGKIQTLEQTLAIQGWKKQHESFYQLLIKKLGNHPTKTLTSIWGPPLYLNHRPVLVMHYYEAQTSKIFILRLWRSNYHLLGNHQPIWLGNVYVHTLENNQYNVTRFNDSHIQYLQKFLKGYSLKEINTMPINKKNKNNTLHILLIREMNF